MRAGIDTKGRQINKLHDRIDTKVRQTDLDQQARHLLEIFVRTLKPLWKLKRLLAIWAVLRTTVIVGKACKEVKMEKIVYNNTG